MQGTARTIFMDLVIFWMLLTDLRRMETDKSVRLMNYGNASYILSLRVAIPRAPCAAWLRVVMKRRQRAIKGAQMGQ